MALTDKMLKACYMKYSNPGGFQGPTGYSSGQPHVAQPCCSSTMTIKLGTSTGSASTPKVAQPITQGPEAPAADSSRHVARLKPCMLHVGVCIDVCCHLYCTGGRVKPSCSTGDCASNGGRRVQNLGLGAETTHQYKAVEHPWLPCLRVLLHACCCHSWVLQQHLGLQLFDSVVADGNAAQWGTRHSCQR